MEKQQLEQSEQLQESQQQTQQKNDEADLVEKEHENRAIDLYAKLKSMNCYNLLYLILL